MKKHIMKKLVIAGVLALTPVVAASAAMAQNSGNPAQIQGQGGHNTEEVTVFNLGDDPFRRTVQIVDKQTGRVKSILPDVTWATVSDIVSPRWKYKLVNYVGDTREKLMTTTHHQRVPLPNEAGENISREVNIYDVQITDIATGEIQFELYGLSPLEYVRFNREIGVPMASILRNILRSNRGIGVT